MSTNQINSNDLRQAYSLYGDAVQTEDLRQIQEAIFKKPTTLHNKYCYRVLENFKVKGGYLEADQNGKVTLLSKRGKDPARNCAARMKLWNGLVAMLNSHTKAVRAVTYNSEENRLVYNEKIFAPFGNIKSLLEGKAPKYDGTALGEMEKFFYDAHAKLLGGKNMTKPLGQLDALKMMDQATSLMMLPEFRLGRDFPGVKDLEGEFVLGLSPNSRASQKQRSLARKQLGDALFGKNKPFGFFHAGGYDPISVKPLPTLNGNAGNGLLCVFAKRSDRVAYAKGKISKDEFDSRCKRVKVVAKEVTKTVGKGKNKQTVKKEKLVVKDVTSAYVKGEKKAVKKAIAPRRAQTMNLGHNRKLNY